MTASINLTRLARTRLASSLLMGCLLCAGAGQTQQPLPATSFDPIGTATASLLQQMTRMAGVIFTGEVIAVHRPGFADSGQNAAESVVTIEFRVDQALRGCTSGSIYTLREWSGLWVGQERYTPGKHLLVFLRPPNSAGLSSTVHGVEGIIPLRGGGLAPGPYDTTAGAAMWMADLRWVQAQSPREPAVQSRPVRWPPREIELISSRTTTLYAIPNLSLDPESGPRGDLPMPWLGAPSASTSALHPLTEVLDLCRGDGVR